MDIYILSSGRPFRQDTWGALPKKIRERVVMLVPEKEVTAYANVYPCVLPCPVMGIGRTRQFAVSRSAAGKLVMLDDDLTFAVRRTDEPHKFLPAEDVDIEDMFEEIEDKLDSFAHVGVATREGGNRNTERYLHTTRMLRILAYDARVLKKEHINFNRLPVMEDFDVTLRLLRLGYDNVLLNRIVHNQYGSNAAGGCSQYRTMEVQEKAAKDLAALHHPYVRLVRKQTKGAWGGQARTDVVISWKQAYSACPKPARQLAGA